MKIIKQGTISHKTIRFTCDKCHCVFEATGKEYKYRLDTKNEDWYELDCPCCASRVTQDARSAVFMD